MTAHRGTAPPASSFTREMTSTIDEAAFQATTNCSCGAYGVE
jgi:hypothetical protein